MQGLVQIFFLFDSMLLYEGKFALNPPKNTGPILTLTLITLRLPQISHGETKARYLHRPSLLNTPWIPHKLRFEWFNDSCIVLNYLCASLSIAYVIIIVSIVMLYLYGLNEFEFFYNVTTAKTDREERW